MLPPPGFYFTFMVIYFIMFAKILVHGRLWEKRNLLVFHQR